MTVRALAGLLALNLVFQAVGLFVLYAVRGWRTWGELLRLAGVAYVLGMSTTGVVWVLELVAAVPFTLLTLASTFVGIACVSGLAGKRLGRPLPAGRIAWRPISPLGALLGAATAILLEALFRSGRLAGLYEYDAWAFWVAKARAIYFFHGLDHQFFTSLPGPSYPPLLPALEAAAFHFMGSTDPVTLHLQFWFLFVGFVAALVGLLAPRVPPLLLGAPLLVSLIAPQVVGRALQTQADLLLDEQFALAAVLLAVWVLERQTWTLVAASVLLAGAMVTKREGFLLTACVVVAALAASWAERRAAWPRLVAMGALAFLPSLAWRVWFESKGLPSDTPEAGGAGLFRHLDRAWPSLRLTVRDLFTYDLWLVVAPLALLAVLAALLAGRRALAGYAGLLFVFGVAGFTWITWSFPSLPITENPALNPITRAVGSLVLVSAGLVPLLLAEGWRVPEGGQP